MKDVYLGYLRPDGNVSTSFHESLWELFNYDAGHGQHIAARHPIECAGNNELPEARNFLAKNLLESECEWLFMVDSDMGFEPFALDQLLAVADPVTRPVVGGLCFAYRNRALDGFNGWRKFPLPTLFDPITHPSGAVKVTGRTHYPVNALMRVGGTGAAFLLIHRSVLERMAAEYGPVWFDRLTDEEGDVLGEDISFCARLLEMDIPLHVHTGIRTTHHKSLWVGEPDFWASFFPGPATQTVDVVVPVLSRPKNVRPFMESLRDTTGLATAWFICNENDEEEIRAALDAGAEVITSTARTFAEKVNVAYAKTAAPWLLLVGDDVRFHPGWFRHAMAVAEKYDAKVVGTNDLANPRVIRGEHATHPLISRKYIDEVGASWDGPGVVCHEGYRHWFVDDEIVTAAKQRGVFQASLGSQVEHMHPYFGKGEMDAVYELGQKHADEDGALFKRRFESFAA